MSDQLKPDEKITAKNFYTKLKTVDPQLAATFKFLFANSLNTAIQMTSEAILRITAYTKDGIKVVGDEAKPLDEMLEEHRHAFDQDPELLLNDDDYSGDGLSDLWPDIFADHTT